MGGGAPGQRLRKYDQNRAEQAASTTLDRLRRSANHPLVDEFIVQTTAAFGRLFIGSDSYRIELRGNNFYTSDFAGPPEGHETDFWGDALIHSRLFTRLILVRRRISRR